MGYAVECHPRRPAGEKTQKLPTASALCARTQIAAILLENAALLPLGNLVPLSAFHVAKMPPTSAIDLIRVGLPAGSFDAAAKVLSLTVDELAAKLGISPRTIRDQRKKKVRLSSEHSEKLVRIARIQTLARSIFSTDAAVAEWLNAPALALNGIKPIDLVDTDTGAREIEAVLHGIAYGNVM